MDSARPKATTAEYTALVKAEHVQRGLCVNCKRKVALKPDGTPYRKCKRHLEYDRKRNEAKRYGDRLDRREYVKRKTPLLTRADRRHEYQREGRCACGQERDSYKHDRHGNVMHDENGRPVMAKSCSRCLNYSRLKYAGGGRVPVYCTSCQAYGFHRDDCETLKE